MVVLWFRRTWVGLATNVPPVQASEQVGSSNLV